MVRKRDILVQILITLLAFGIGIMIGKEHCSESTETSHATTAEATLVERLVEKPCPPVQPCPDDTPEPPLPSETKTARRAPAPKKLPPDVDQTPPLDRERLLAWVRSRSPELAACRDDSKDVYRLNVTVRVNEQRDITRVDFNTAPGEVPSATIQCLRQHILTWKPPADLVAEQTQLIFGLTL